MLQIASFLYFVCVPFIHAHLVIDPRAIGLHGNKAELNYYYYWYDYYDYYYFVLKLLIIFKALVLNPYVHMLCSF
jgi:hypothetical protein